MHIFTLRLPAAGNMVPGARATPAVPADFSLHTSFEPKVVGYAFDAGADLPPQERAAVERKMPKRGTRLSVAHAMKGRPATARPSRQPVSASLSA